MAHKPRSLRSPTTESPAARYTLMAVAFLFLALFLLLPLAAVFVEAFRKGPGEFFTAFGKGDFGAAAEDLAGGIGAIGQKINEIGEELAEIYKVPHLTSDFKKKNGYKRSIELSHEHALYRQNYCGCAFSKAEREAQIANA